MADKKIEIDEIMSLLAACCSQSRPDEYQQRHNQLLRQLAAYIIQDYMDTLPKEIDE